MVCFCLVCVCVCGVCACLCVCVWCAVNNNMHVVNIKLCYLPFEFSSCFTVLGVWVRLPTARTPKRIL